jgi:hypothetical protein
VLHYVNIIFVLAEIFYQFLSQEASSTYPEAKPSVGKEILRSRRILEKTTGFLSDQQYYEVGILWAKDNVNLPDNFQQQLILTTFR